MSEPSALPPELQAQLETLGGHLVWRIGKDEASEDVIVRVGYASATPRFAFLPRLRAASDAEVQDALARGAVVIEWVD
ncbi:DUF3248 domain-containing protein [Deinococcus maricopensis]|uniref:DUF3248 domain-containing protein n=1 Tax=Deinococcus maricopensis (strain DSM 21211 / LMG 22137 / NRRL B-23946 / LB-34) TaxID=709986 RepID=E8U3M5_DEIML|nr:DUF3248 domain-containing protein [Deinococcus maricopensis]ADV68649.1 hypothetical protein Deima_3020 [Deinococcus maricopensis DSM 21211]